MTVSMQELRGASYEAADLETAFVPTLASRSILQTLSLTTRDYGIVAVTPSTGRVRVRSGKGSLNDLLAFVEDALAACEAAGESEFLKAFALPVEVSGLDAGIEPTGILFDRARLLRLLKDSSHTIGADATGCSPDTLLGALAVVHELQSDGEGWKAVDPRGKLVARVKRQQSTFGIRSDLAKGFVLQNGSGDQERLDRWIREEQAFSLSFSSPEYFYANGSLYKTAGFRKEAELVREFFRPHASLVNADSEKGCSYGLSTTRFAPASIFRLLEDDLTPGDTHLFCGDLGDEWADYIGANAETVTFYHCKHGSVTTGASDVQIVTAQALKNLGRIRFRQDDIRTKLQLASSRAHWGDTQIPLLARCPGGWTELEQHLLRMIARPTTRWHVALVVTALSLQAYETNLCRAALKPHFIQQVWLLSAFVSACRERGAQPVVICRP